MVQRQIKLYVPVITPFAEDFSVDHARFVALSLALLEAGAHGLAPFGTTSEANSLTVAERKAALEVLIEAGIPADCLIPGTGCCAVGDSVELSTHAVALGCRGVLALPPFYYKGVSDEGVFDAFARLIEGVADPRLRVYLYHIPNMSGVPITLPLIERLVSAYPKAIAGLKDSSGDWQNTLSVIDTFPDLLTFSSSEALIPENAAAGGAGCISASANVNTAGIRRLIDALGTERESDCHAQVSAVRSLFESLPLIPAIKTAVAMQRDDPDFARLRPPFMAAGETHAAKITEAVALARSGPNEAAGGLNPPAADPYAAAV